MQRTFTTEMPEKLSDDQVVVDLPRYEVPLTRALIRRDVNNFNRFSSDNESINVTTTVNHIKMFVDELAQVDKDINASARVPYGTFVGLRFTTTGEAVKWARSFVRRFFPDTEERLFKKELLNIPFTKTEIVWLGDEKYLPFIQKVAISPSTDELVSAVDTKAKPTITREDASKLRAELAAKRGKKEHSTVTP